MVITLGLVFPALVSFLAFLACSLLSLRAVLVPVVVPVRVCWTSWLPPAVSLGCQVRVAATAWAGRILRGCGNSCEGCASAVISGGKSIFRRSWKFYGSSSACANLGRLPPRHMRSWSGLVVLLAAYSALKFSGRRSMNAFSSSNRYCYMNSLNR